MERSKFLAKVIGLYLVIMTVGMFVYMADFKYHIHAFATDQNLLFLIGVFVLILGLLMVVGHNVWEKSWRTIITVVAWIILLKGAYLIFCPEAMGHLSQCYVESAYLAYIAASFNFLLGVALCYFGFKK